MSLRTWWQGIAWKPPAPIDGPHERIYNALLIACAVPGDDWDAVKAKLGPLTVPMDPSSIVEQVRAAHLDVLMEKITKKEEA